MVGILLMPTLVFGIDYIHFVIACFAAFTFKSVLIYVFLLAMFSRIRYGEFFFLFRRGILRDNNITHEVHEVQEVQNSFAYNLGKKARVKLGKWCARKDSNPRPSD